MIVMRMKEVTVYTLSVPPFQLWFQNCFMFINVWATGWEVGPPKQQFLKFMVSPQRSPYWESRISSCSQERHYMNENRCSLSSLQESVTCYYPEKTFSVHNLLSTTLRRIFILSTHQRSRLPSGRFPWSFPSQAHIHLSFLSSLPFRSIYTNI